jgi:hypothetical protein
MALLLLAILLGQVHPFTAEFEQVTADDKGTDTVRGTVYFAAPWRVYYEVNYPVNQLVSAVMNEMSIYYPGESLAYVIKTSSQFESPTSQQSLGTIDPAQAMSQVGLRPGKTRTAGDTVYSNWTPQHRNAAFGRFTFGRVGRATVFVEAVRRNGKPMMRSRMSDHVLTDTFELPTRIETERFSPAGRRSLEVLTYTAVDTSTAFLRTLGRFAIPSGVRTKTTNW